MPRCGRLRNLIQGYHESHKVQKLIFVVPFLILSLETILITHAMLYQHFFVIILTTVLLAISLIEIILVSREMHEEYIQSNFDRILTIKLDDFITGKKERNVKRIVTDFIEKNPGYRIKRNEIYHTTCQILETHKKESIEKEFINKLEKYVKKMKIEDVDVIVKGFVDKYPKYKRFRSEIYEKTCQLKATHIRK